MFILVYSCLPAITPPLAAAALLPLRLPMPIRWRPADMPARSVMPLDLLVIPGLNFLPGRTAEARTTAGQPAVSLVNCIDPKSGQQYGILGIANQI
jgi:hypothetical protein